MKCEFSVVGGGPSSRGLGSPSFKGSWSVNRLQSGSRRRGCDSVAVTQVGRWLPGQNSAASSLTRRAGSGSPATGLRVPEAPLGPCCPHAFRFPL